MFTSLSVTRNDEKNPEKTVPHNASKRNFFGDQKICSDLNNLINNLNTRENIQCNYEKMN